MCKCMYIYIYIPVYTYILAYICINMNIYVYIHVYIYICVYICINIKLYVCIMYNYMHEHSTRHNYNPHPLPARDNAPTNRIRPPEQTPRQVAKNATATP